MSSQFFSVSAASKRIFLSDSDCTFSAERRKLVALSKNMNLPQLSNSPFVSGVQWQTDFLFDGSDSEVRKRFACLRELFTVPGTDENCEGISV